MVPLSQLASQHRLSSPKIHVASCQDPTHNFPPITKFTVPLLPVTNHALTSTSLLVHLLYPPCCTVFCYAVMLPLQLGLVIRQLLGLCLSYEKISKYDLVAEIKWQLSLLLNDSLFQLAAELLRMAWWDETVSCRGKCNFSACVWAMTVIWNLNGDSCIIFM